MTITWTYWIQGKWHILSGERTVCGRTMPKNRRGSKSILVKLDRCKGCIRAVER